MWKPSKEVLCWSYIRNYDEMLRQGSDEYLALGCQLFTHEDIIEGMIDRKIFLTAENLKEKENLFDKASRHLYNLSYIVHSQQAGRRYWKNFL